MIISANINGTKYESDSATLAIFAAMDRTHTPTIISRRMNPEIFRASTLLKKLLKEMTDIAIRTDPDILDAYAAQIESTNKELNTFNPRDSFHAIRMAGRLTAKGLHGYPQRRAHVTDQDILYTLFNFEQIAGTPDEIEIKIKQAEAAGYQRGIMDERKRSK